MVIELNYFITVVPVRMANCQKSVIELYIKVLVDKQQ